MYYAKQPADAVTPLSSHLGKRILYPRSNWRVMGDVARNDYKIVNERRRRDLLVEWILRMRDAKTAPNMGSLLVE